MPCNGYDVIMIMLSNKSGLHLSKFHSMRGLQGEKLRSPSHPEPRSLDDVDAAHK